MTTQTATTALFPRFHNPIATLAHVIAVAKSRRALAKLDARSLEDVGLSAKVAHDEAGRAFWDVQTNWS
ncbi:MAG: hypothetical protein AAF841_03095 [Pseudomonadota bacterium]